MTTLEAKDTLTIDDVKRAQTTFSEQRTPAEIGLEDIKTDPRRLPEGTPIAEGWKVVEEPAPDDGWQWAIVEIFGHRRHAGRTREEERFGAKMLRVDIPVKGDPEKNGWETIYYGGSSIFSFALTDEASALQFNKPYEPAARYRLSAPETERHAYDDAPSDDDDAPDDKDIPA